ncbi:hypothetical protein ACFYTF_15710 [Nocardia thailandica]|uniref:Uncharacterized protein n=1 Tax=Nocardia thailandica TaxID=257275 RepID=A0ABW6PPI4_9NOCA
MVAGMTGGVEPVEGHGPLAQATGAAEDGDHPADPLDRGEAAGLGAVRPGDPGPRFAEPAVFGAGGVEAEDLPADGAVRGRRAPQAAAQLGGRGAREHGVVRGHEDHRIRGRGVEGVGREVAGIEEQQGPRPALIGQPPQQAGEQRGAATAGHPRPAVGNAISTPERA